jgi:hypothetical protein
MPRRFLNAFIFAATSLAAIFIVTFSSATQTAAQTATQTAAATQRADETSRQSAFRGAESQENIRGELAAVRKNLAHLADDMRLNGYDASEIETLSKTVAALETLDAQDIVKVLAALRSAAAAEKLDARQKTLLEACLRQKEIAVKLGELAAAFSADQTLATVRLRLQNLLLRQLATARLLRPLFGLAPRASLAAADQATITAELALLNKNIRAALAKPSATGTPATGAAATSTASATTATANSTAVLAAFASGGAETISGKAAGDAGNSRFGDALRAQTEIYNALLRPLNALLAAQDTATTLGEFADDIGQLLADQRAVISETEAFQPDFVASARHEGPLRDRARLAEDLLAPLLRDASARLQNARRFMTLGEEDLLRAAHPRHAAKPAMPNIARERLTSASRELQLALALVRARVKELRRAETAALARQVSEVNALLGKLHETRNDIAAQPSPQQADTLKNLAAQAESHSEPAAQHLNDAATAAAALQKTPTPANTPDSAQQQQQPAQQRALAETDAAIKDLEAQAASLEQQLASEVALAQVSEKLDAAQEAANRAERQLEAAQAEAASTPQSGEEPQASEPQSGEQQSGEQQSGEQTEPSEAGENTPSDAAQEAQESLDNAQNELDAIPAEALDAEMSELMQEAREDLEAAKEASENNENEQAKMLAKQASNKIGQMSQKMSQKAGQSKSKKPGSQGKSSNGKGQKKQGSSQSQKGDGRDGGEASHLLQASGGGGGSANVVGKLKPKDREAIDMAAAGRVPAEYEDAVQQYLKNLATARDPATKP